MPRLPLLLKIHQSKKILLDLFQLLLYAIIMKNHAGSRSPRLNRAAGYQILLCTQAAVCKARVVIFVQKQIPAHYRSCVMANAISRFVSDAAELLCAWLLSLMLAAIMEANWTHTWQLAAVNVVCLTACALLVWLTGKWSSRVTDAAQQRYRERLCEAVIRQRTWFPTSGELHARMEKDADTITQFFSMACPQGIVALLELAVCGILLALQHGWLALIFLLMSLLQMLPTLHMKNGQNPFTKRPCTTTKPFQTGSMPACAGLRP